MMNDTNGINYEKDGYFEFPFTPYNIQQDFMRKLYYALQNDKIGIFESPTGTVSTHVVSYSDYFILFYYLNFRKI